MTFERFIAGIFAALLLMCCAVTAGAMWAGWHLYQRVSRLIENADRSVIIAGGAATDLQKTLALERQAAAAQIAQAAAAESALAQSADSLNALVRDTDRSLNDPKTGLLPGLAEIPTEAPLESLAAVERQAGDFIADLRTTNGELDASIQNFNAAAQQIDRALPATLGNIQATSANVEAITATSKDTAAEIDGTAKDFHAFVHRETAPARGVWHTIKGAVSWLVEPGAAIATAAK